MFLNKLSKMHTYFLLFSCCVCPELVQGVLWGKKFLVNKSSFSKKVNIMEMGNHLPGSWKRSWLCREFHTLWLLVSKVHKQNVIFYAITQGHTRILCFRNPLKSILLFKSPIQKMVPHFTKVIRKHFWEWSLRDIFLFMLS